MAIDNFELFENYRQTKANNTRNKIAEKYLYIAEILAKKFANRGVDYEDLYQVAVVALIKGIDRFDERLNLQFVTFITPTIAGEIKNYFRDKSRLIKIPRKMYGLAVEAKKYINEVLQTTGKMLTYKEVAKYFKVTEEELVSALETSNTATSLDSKVDGMESDLYEIIPDSNNWLDSFEDKESIKSALVNLNDREREFISLRFVEEQSQSEIAKKWNVSQMFVSRLEKKILVKLREEMFKELA